MGRSVSYDKTGKKQNYYTLQYILDTFKALVDAIIPRTPGLPKNMEKYNIMEP